MAWIKAEHETPDKPEVFELAHLLQLSPDDVLGKLWRTWVWFDQQTTDGNAPSVTQTVLDTRIGVTGWCVALVKVGWLSIDGIGLHVTHFDRHNGATAKNRALTKKRVDKHRTCNAPIVTPSGNGPSVTKALPEKRRVREEKKEELLPLALAGGGDGAESNSSETPNSSNGKPRERRPLWDWAACHGYGGLDAKRTKAQAKELGAMERDLVALDATPTDCDARWDILARLWKVPPTVRSLIKHWHECIDQQAENDRRIYGEPIRA
jgi:hypothetical protein